MRKDVDVFNENIMFVTVTVNSQPNDMTAFFIK